MDVLSGANTLLPGDSRLIDHIVGELKNQGIFDQFRKECIADVDTKPAYQNLRQRVENNVHGFLRNQRWTPETNKNQLREVLRKNITESGFLETGVERIVNQVVNPKINSVFLPKVEEVVYKYLGINKPNRSNNIKNGPLSVNATVDLLPTDLEAISPDSEVLDKTLNKSSETEEKTHEDLSKPEEDHESPPFEPLNEKSVHDDSSNDSHLSGISGLTSNDSNASNSSPKKTYYNIPEVINNDSHLSKVSSTSHLSIITTEEKLSSEKMDISDDTQNSSSKKSNLEFEKVENGHSNFNIKDQINVVLTESPEGAKLTPKADKDTSEMEMDVSDSQDKFDFAQSFELKIQEATSNLEDFNKSLENDSKDSCPDAKELNGDVKPQKEDSKDLHDSKDTSQDSKSASIVSQTENHDFKNNDDTKNSKTDTKIESRSSKTDFKDSKDTKNESKDSKSDSKSSRDKSSSKDSRSNSKESKSSSRSDSKDSKSRDSSRHRSHHSESKDRKHSDEKKSHSSHAKDRSKDKKSHDSKDSKSRDSKDDKERKSSSSSSSKHSSRDKQKSKNSHDKDSRSKSDSKSSKKESKDSKSDSKKENSKADSKRSNDRKSDSKKSDDHKKSSESSKKDSSKSSSDKRRSSSSKSSSKDSKDRKSSSSSSSHHKKESSEKSSKKSSSKDDHSSSKDKKTSRRSTDRDSNDGSSGSKSASNAKSTTNGTSGSNKNSESSTSFSASGSGDSGQSDKVENSDKNEVSKIEHAENDRDTDSPISLDGQIRIKKPKFASNIFEARKLMKIRKKMEKREKKRQLALMEKAKNNMEAIETKEEPTPSIKTIIELDETKDKKTEPDEEILVAKPISVISKASWDAMEAQMMNVDYNSYGGGEDKEDSCSSDKSLDNSATVNIIEENQTEEIDMEKVGEESSRKSSDEEECLYFSPQISPTVQRFLQKVDDMKRSTDVIESIIESKRAKKPANKYPINEYSAEVNGSDAVKESSPDNISVKTDNKKRKGIKRKNESMVDGIDNENNNKKMHILEDVENDDPQSENNSQTDITSKLRSNKSKNKSSVNKKSNESLNDSYSMPLSPESIGSTNSLESKGILQKSSEERGTLVQHIYSTQSSTLKTPKGQSTGSKQQQRYSSDDLYKPRPLFSGSRRSRGIVNNADKIVEESTSKTRR